MSPFLCLIIAIALSILPTFVSARTAPELIAALKGSIIPVVHNRISPSVPLGQTGVELLIEARDAEHISLWKQGLTAHQYRVEMLD